jgi:protein transport protein SEC23
MGPGTVVGLKLEETIRSFLDFQKENDNTKNFKKAQKYYQGLTQRAIKANLVFDTFGFSLDQYGLMEMRSLTEKTGGYVVMHEVFNSEMFKDSFKKLFDKDANGDLKMGFAAKLDMLVSKELKISGAIGPCTSLKKGSPLVAEVEVGQGGTTSWYLGGIDRASSLAFYFDLAPQPQGKEIVPGKIAFFQFQTVYKHASGKIRLRVTTTTRRFADPNNIFDLAQGFDQEAACCIMARLGVVKAETEEPLEVLKWLDRSLIRLVCRFAEYKKDDISSFRLSKEFSLYPQFMYHLRRSHFLQTFGASPDESAFYRMTLLRENTTNSLVMIQPALLQYSFECPQPVPVLLDINSLKENVILLLDTYFHVLVW